VILVTAINAFLLQVQGWHLLYILGLRVVNGIAASYLCHASRLTAEEHVVIAKTLKPIAAFNAKILHSLMPPEIVHMCQEGDKTRQDQTDKNVKKED